MAKVTRYGSISRLTPEKAAYYKALHADPWKEINEMIKECNIENYSIYFHDNFLFSYYEYTGEDYEADMAKMAEDPMTQKWWGECVPCMNPLSDQGPWLDMQEIYHLD